MSARGAALRGPFALVLLPVVLAFGLMGSSVKIPFLLDDLVAGQLLVRDGAVSVERVGAMIWPTAAEDRYNDHFRPLGWLSISFDTACFGFLAPWMHLVALLIHGMNGVLVAALARRLSAAPGWLMPVLCGALFVAWPAAPEPVMWVAHRFTLLSTFWFLLAALAVVGLDRKGARGLLFVAALGALLSKDSMLSQVWCLPALAVFAGPGPRLRRVCNVGWLVGLAFGLAAAARWLCTGGFVPRLSERDGDVVESFDLTAMLAALPEALARFAFPVRGVVIPSLVVLLPLGLVLGKVALRGDRSSKSLGGAPRAGVGLLIALLGASLPVLSLNENLEGARHFYLPAAALCLALFQALMSLTQKAGRGGWIGGAAVILFGLLIVHNREAYELAGEHVVATEAAIEGAARSANREVVVSGLPPTFRGAPLFGLRSEHLRLRFIPPLRPTPLKVLGATPSDLGGALLTDQPLTWLAYPATPWGSSR